MSDPIFLTRLWQWMELKRKLTSLALEEVFLRRELFKEAFPTPDEGTNSYSLPKDWVLKGVHKIDRKIDDAAYTVLRPKFEEQKIPCDTIIRLKPELVIAEYRKLNDAQMHLFDQALIVKPSETPSMEVVLPAKAKK